MILWFLQLLSEHMDVPVILIVLGLCSYVVMFGTRWVH